MSISRLTAGSGRARSNDEHAARQRVSSDMSRRGPSSIYQPVLCFHHPKKAPRLAYLNPKPNDDQKQGKKGNFPLFSGGRFSSFWSIYGYSLYLCTGTMSIVGTCYSCHLSLFSSVLLIFFSCFLSQGVCVPLRNRSKSIVGVVLRKYEGHVRVSRRGIWWSCHLGVSPLTFVRGVSEVCV